MTAIFALMAKNQEMKKLFFALLLAICVTPALAQITHTPNGHVDKNAETILKKASQKFTSDAASFTVTMVNKDANKKETAKMKANVLYKKGKYRVTFDDNIIYCDGSSTWHWNKESNEVVVNKMSNAEDDLMNPAAILANYSKNFNAKYIRQEENGNAIIDLTPKKSKSYYKLRLFINSTNNQLQRMEMHNYDSSCGEYQLSNYKSGVKVNDSDFSFQASKNPNVDIIDMR